jgi:hypothetical protein
MKLHAFFPHDTFLENSEGEIEGFPQKIFIGVDDAFAAGPKDDP